MNLLEIVSARRGHFLLESGHHGELWLDLDSLFAEPRKVESFVSVLAESVARYDIDIVCGPLLGGAFLAQLIASSLGITFCFTERVIPEESTGLFRARYLLPPSFRERVRGKRIAIVDDVMSAGSALRGTMAELDSLGAHTIVAGALLVWDRPVRTIFAIETCR